MTSAASQGGALLLVLLVFLSVSVVLDLGLHHTCCCVLPASFGVFVLNTPASCTQHTLEVEVLGFLGEEVLALVFLSQRGLL